MKYEYKNEAVNEIMEFNDTVQGMVNSGEVFENEFGPVEFSNMLLASYAKDIIEQAKDSNSPDFTYKTLPKLNELLIALWLKRSEWTSIAENKDMLAKSLAAYLTLLAVNEHDAGLYVSFMVKESEAEDLLWADTFSIAFGSQKHSVDLLPICQEAVNSASHLMPGGVILDMLPVRKAYASITGIDLADYILMSIAIERRTLGTLNS